MDVSGVRWKYARLLSSCGKKILKMLRFRSVGNDAAVHIYDLVDNVDRISTDPDASLHVCIVGIAWIFFRARNLDTAFQIISRLFALDNYFSAAGWNFDLGLDAADFAMMLLGLIAFIVIEFAGRKRSLITWVSQRALPIRWALYLLLLFTIVLFGYYPTSEAARFLYSQF